jgi:hypothetical protein
MAADKPKITDEWIILTGDEVQARGYDGYLETEWTSVGAPWYRIRNPHYIKPTPSVFDRCVVGKTVVREKGSRIERLVISKGERLLTLGGKDGDGYTVEELNDFEIIRGGSDER